MAFLAVDKDGTELIFDTYPYKADDEEWLNNFENPIELPAGTIAKLLDGKALSFSDDPVSIPNQADKKITLVLNHSEADKLNHVLQTSLDEGIHNEGFQSPELEHLRDKINTEITIQKRRSND